MTDTPPPYDGPIIDQDDELVANLTTPAAPGPARRAARGVQQQVIGLLLSIPVSVGALTAAGVDVDPKIAAIAVGVPTALAGVVSAVWNLVDAVRGNG